MRIRLPFAGIFFLLLVVAGYAGLSSLQLGGVVNDKLLHFVTFFLLTVAFYWIVDTSRRRTLNMALVVCTGGLGIGSEIVQGALPDNGRVFDLMDIVANVLGSLAALALCSWYHKRMLERKRQHKYAAVPGDEGIEGLSLDDPGTIDVELGEGIGGGHSTILHDGDDDTEAVTSTTASAAVATPTSTAAGSSGASGPVAAATTAAPRGTLEEELDNWDENAEDPWDEDDTGDIGGGSGPTKKRTD